MPKQTNVSKVFSRYRWQVGYERWFNVFLNTYLEGCNFFSLIAFAKWLKKDSSVTRGKMRQRDIMRQLSCYGFQNQLGRESVKSILFHGNLGYTFKPTTTKMTKRSHDVNEKRYLSCAICLFLVAAAFLMSSEIY